MSFQETTALNNVYDFGISHYQLFYTDSWMDFFPPSL